MSDMASAAIRRITGEEQAQPLDVGTIQAMVRDTVESLVTKKFDAEREFLLQDCIVRSAERVREMLQPDEEYYHEPDSEEVPEETVEESTKSWKV